MRSNWLNCQQRPWQIMSGDLFKGWLAQLWVALSHPLSHSRKTRFNPMSLSKIIPHICIDIHRGVSIVLVLHTVAEPGFFKWGGKLLTNTWYYILYRYALYREINLKYMYQLISNKINVRILSKWKN
jgi:hypothetical protein